MVKKLLRTEEDWDKFVDWYYDCTVETNHYYESLKYVKDDVKPNRFPTMVVYTTKQIEGHSYIDFLFVNKEDLM